MTRGGYIEASDPVECGHCGYIAPIDQFGGVALPDGMVRCEECGGVSETISGIPIDEEDLELRTHELESCD